MKRLFALAAAAAMLILCSCGSKTEETAQNEPQAESAKIEYVEKYNRTGRIQSVDYYKYDAAGQYSVDYSIKYSYNDAGSLTQVKKEGNGLENSRFLESYFYSGTNLTSSSVTNLDGTYTEEHTYKYSSNGALLTDRCITTERTSSGTVKDDTTKTYDADGRLSKLEGEDETGRYRREYVYSEATGRLTEEIYYHSSDGKTYRAFSYLYYFYDGAGNLTKTQEKDITEAAVSVTVNTYDEENRLLTSIEYIPDDSSEDNLISRYSCEYDAAGNLLWEADTYPEGTGSRTDYEYDEAGNVIKKTLLTYFGTDDTRQTVTTTEYDEYNNPVTQTTVDFNGNETVDFIYSYEYYESGGLISKTSYAV